MENEITIGCINTRDDKSSLFVNTALCKLGFGQNIASTHSFLTVKLSKADCSSAITQTTRTSRHVDFTKKQTKAIRPTRSRALC